MDVDNIATGAAPVDSAGGRGSDTLRLGPDPPAPLDPAPDATVSGGDASAPPHDVVHVHSAAATADDGVNRAFDVEGPLTLYETCIMEQDEYFIASMSSGRLHANRLAIEWEGVRYPFFLGLAQSVYRGTWGPGSDEWDLAPH